MLLHFDVAFILILFHLLDIMKLTGSLYGSGVGVEISCWFLSDSLAGICTFLVPAYPGLSLQCSAVEQVLDILMDILSWEVAEVVSPCLPRGL